MATQTITQVRRIVFRKWNSTTSKWSTWTLEADDLGQDTTMTFNVAPRLKARDSQIGSTEVPIKGTFQGLAASVTFLADTWAIIGKAIDMWNAATFSGATANDGNIIYGSDSLCDGGEYESIVAQGLCDDGSSTDVEFTRCIPSIDDDIEIGTSKALDVTLNLHPIIYNPTTHANDGYPEYTARKGDEDLTTKKRLNVTTGEYAAVTGAQSIIMTRDMTIKSILDDREKETVTVYRTSDFIDEEDRKKLDAANAKGREKKKQFDDVDSLVGEIIARFGYDTYLAWDSGEFDDDKMSRIIMAERARDRQQFIPIESIQFALGAAQIHKEKNKPAPKGYSTALRIMEEEIKIAKGEK